MCVLVFLPPTGYNTLTTADDLTKRRGFWDRKRRNADPDFGKGEANLIPYATEGGYYAAYLRPASWGTIGGVITDDQMRVLNTEGEVIPNVFAVGESATSRLFGDYYLGGFSLGLYATMGRLAAETAVSELAK